MPTPLLDPPTEFAIGAATGLLDCCAFHWIDTLKVRSQANLPLLLDLQRGGPLPPGSGSLAALRSLYAGFTTNLSLKLPYMAFAFGLNALNGRVLSACGGSLSETARELVSAALVGVEVSLFLSPLEMVCIAVVEDSSSRQSFRRGYDLGTPRIPHSTPESGREQPEQQRRLGEDAQRVPEIARDRSVSKGRTEAWAASSPLPAPSPPPPPAAASSLLLPPGRAG